MKVYALLALGALALAPVAAGCSNPATAAPADPETITTAAPVEARANVGKPAPDFTLKDTDGNEVSLASFKGKTVVLEWYNPDCPFVKKQHKAGPLATMAKDVASDGVVWLAVNSSAKGKQGHGVDRNKRSRKEYGLEHPVLIDEPGDVGRLYGAKTTPHMFIVDAEGVVRYAGAIDNAPFGEIPADGFKNYVEMALKEMKANKPVTVSKTDPYGCTVKY